MRNAVTNMAFDKYFAPSNCRYNTNSFLFNFTMTDIAKVVKIDTSTVDMSSQVDIFCKMYDDLKTSPVVYDTKNQVLRISYQTFKCDFFKYTAPASNDTCPIAPTSSDAIISVNMTA